MARSRPGAALEMIRAVTRLCPVPLVPEIQLHQAGEPISLWERTERAAGTGLVLVGDAFYQRDLAGRVMRLLLRGHARGAAVLIGDPGRTYLPRDRLVPLAAYEVPGLAALEDTDRKRTTVWRLA